jgi:glycosyltransferase involved in cell wall biosynthesis
MTDDASWRGKRILFVSIYYYPEKTGIAPYTTSIARHLAAKDAEVRSLVGVPHYPHWEWYEGYDKGMRLHENDHGVAVRRSRMYLPKEQTAVKRGLYEATFALKSMAARRGGRPDAVVGVIPNLGGGLAAAYHAAVSRAPLGLIVQDVTGAAAEQSGIKGGGGKVAGATKRLEQWILRRAGRISVVSEGFRSYIEEGGVPGDRIVSLPNWSQVPEATKSKAEARQELGWSDDKKIVIHAGNMGLKQGLEHVLDAAELAQGTRPDVEFIFMGDGNQRPALQDRARNLTNVRFVESRYGVDYPNALVAADVLLVNERGTVRDMSLPSKLTSYFLAGRPVLASVVPDGVTAREIERSGGGIVVPAEQPDALLEGLERLLNDPSLSEKFAASGIAYAREHLSEDKALSRSEDFVRSIIASKKAH